MEKQFRDIPVPQRWESPLSGQSSAVVEPLLQRYNFLWEGGVTENMAMGRWNCDMGCRLSWSVMMTMHDPSTTHQ